MAERACLLCNGPLPEQKGRGRPRKFCLHCAPPGDNATARRTWRAAHPEAYARQIMKRRIAYHLKRKAETPWHRIPRDVRDAIDEQDS